MKDWPVRLADLLEEWSAKVRAMTVDRAVRAISITAGATVGAALLLLALIWLSIGIFRALSVPLTEEGAYASLGGLFIVAGAFVWAKRKPKRDND